MFLRPHTSIHSRSRASVGGASFSSSMPAPTLTGHGFPLALLAVAGRGFFEASHREAHGADSHDVGGSAGALQQA